MSRGKIRKRGSVGSVGSAELLPLLRDLYSKYPEYWCHEPWELVHVLFSLGYVEDLADEGETTRTGCYLKLITDRVVGVWQPARTTGRVFSRTLHLAPTTSATPEEGALRVA
jgi:hypothetical protein